MHRAILCTDEKRAKKFMVLNAEYLSGLLRFADEQAHVSAAMSVILDTIQGAKLVFHHRGRTMPETTRVSMQGSWLAFILSFMRHLYVHGFVITCLKPDANGRVTPTIVNTENVIVAQYSGETHRGEYAVFRKSGIGGGGGGSSGMSLSSSGKDDPVNTMFMGASLAQNSLSTPQSQDLMQEVIVFESQDRAPIGGRIRSVVATLYQLWQDLAVAQTCALRAAARMADPALVMEPLPLDNKQVQLMTGLRENAATDAALSSMDTGTNLADLMQADDRVSAYQALVAEQNAQRMGHAGVTVPQSAARVMMDLEAKRATQNGMPNTERVQVPMGYRLVNQLHASEPGIYNRLADDFCKWVALSFGIPNSVFADRGLGTVAGDVGDLQRLERRTNQCFSTAESLCTFFWSRLTRISDSLTPDTDTHGVVRLQDVGLEQHPQESLGQSGNDSDDDDDDDEEAGLGKRKRRGSSEDNTNTQKRSEGVTKKARHSVTTTKKSGSSSSSSGTSEEEPEVAVYLRANPPMEKVMMLWEAGMLKWDSMRMIMSQVMGLPTDAFVAHLKPQSKEELSLQQKEVKIKDQTREDNVRVQQQMLRQKAQEKAATQEKASASGRGAGVSTSTPRTGTR
jgi:hypothetical protein